MRKSELILPLRIYDDLFDQSRFDRNCAGSCEPVIKYPINELPNFQFTRSSALTTPSEFILRNVCNDLTASNFYKSVPELAAKFVEQYAIEYYGPIFPLGASATFDNGGSPILDPDSPVASISECGGLVNAPNEGYSAYTTTGPYANFVINTLGVDYKFKLIVEEFQRSGGSIFEINVYQGVTLLQSITAPGIYIIDISGAGGAGIKVEFFKYQADDKFKISYAQAFIVNPLDSVNNSKDITLDETKLTVKPLNTGNDIILYCSDTTNYAIPEGDYYYIVKIGSVIYYSEVFKLFGLAKSQQFYKLTWYNQCDINSNVLYSNTSTGCFFRNILYLDAELFDPKYNTNEETEPNGNSDENTVFKRWEKTTNFDIIKSPPFLTDALSAIFIHDTVSLLYPLNTHQEIANNEYSILKVTSEVSDNADNCFQTVVLKLLTTESFTKTGCCNSAGVYSCPADPNYYAYTDCSGDHEYSLLLNLPPEPGDGLTRCSTGERVNVLPTDLIQNDADGVYFNLVLDGDGLWTYSKIYPSIVDANLAGPFYFVEGFILPFTFVEIEYNYDSGGWINTGASPVQGNSEGEYSIAIDSSLAAGATTFQLRAKMKTVNCPNMATSYIFNVI